MAIVKIVPDRWHLNAKRLNNSVNRCLDTYFFDGSLFIRRCRLFCAASSLTPSSVQFVKMMFRPKSGPPETIKKIISNIWRMNKNRKMEMDAERLNLLQIDFDFDSVLPLSLALLPFRCNRH